MMESTISGHGLKGEELSRFISKFKHSHLNKGSLLISSGGFAKDLAFIESGYLRTFHVDEKGNEITTEFSGPGSFCSSYYSFYTGEPAFESIEAITDCDLRVIDRISLENLYSASLQINILGRKILQNSCIERDLRLKKVLHLPAIKKYQWFLEHYRDVYKISRLGHIASFLGMTQETLSRVRRNFLKS